jgi:hypothetical protein
MKANERIQNAVKSADMEVDNIDKLISLAYYMGRESAAKEVCDAARKTFGEQHKRAIENRYHLLAEKVVGNVTHIYHPDYAGDMTDMFGSDETKL